MAIRNSQNHDPKTGTQGLLGRLAGIPAGRRSKWLVLAVWLLVLVAVSPFAGKLQDVEENDAAAWLPAGSESLEVAELQDQFQDDDTMMAVVVYHRDEGLTPADHDQIATDQEAIRASFPESIPSDPILSDDGNAAIVTFPLFDVEDEEEGGVIDDTKQIRDLIGEGAEDGLQVKVTGPAGFTTDMVSVFSGIDGTLLIATASVVTVLLLITYRSPFLWLLPLLVVAFAHQGAMASVYGLAKHAGLPVNGQSGGILPVLVFGVGTDYALLLIARYREELRRHEDKHQAMAVALRRAGPAILASGMTCIIGLLCLLAADLNATRGFGPIGAVGIFTAMVAMMTLLPVALVIFGRGIFWPFVPRVGDALQEASSFWSRVGTAVSRNPRRVWLGTVAVLAVLAMGLTGIDTNLPQTEQFRNEPDSVVGQQLIAESFPAGASQPNTIIARAETDEAVQAAIAGTPGVAEVRVDGQAGDLLTYAVTLDASPSSQAAFDTIELLRDNLHAVPGAEALVGGPDAESLDIATTSSRDQMVVMPLVLVVVLLILAVLLRAIVVPLLLIGTVVLSFAAALGTSVVVFDQVFGFAGMDPSVPLLGFVFLVALGIDYNIFLMSRVHEESAVIGTRKGMLKGLAVTGGVITSAGLVLAATFSVLGVLPLVMMTQLGFIVAFGVLLDAFIVRSILVPALTLDLGRRIWWPSRLSRGATDVPAREPAPTTAGEPVMER